MTKPNKAERKRRIVAELRANPTVRISTLAEAFSVSAETVRRDIDELSITANFSEDVGTVGRQGIDPRETAVSDCRTKINFNDECRHLPAPGARSRVLLVNSPNNPTGAVLTPSEMERVVELAAESGALVYADEVYRGVELDGPEGPSFRDLDPKQWAKYVDVNLYGVMNCTKAVLDSMLERRWGRIVTISSGAGQMGVGIGISIYGAGKAGAIGFSRHLALEVAVCRRHQAHVHVDRTRAAHSFDLALLERAQELRLDAEREVADLVQEQRALFRNLHQTSFHLLRVGERPAFVAE